ncbi:MAG: RsmE family RNA methyltransferase [bacterium]
MKRGLRRDEAAADRVAYAPPEAWRDDEVLLADAEHHHLSRVLRFDAGDEITIVDGEGGRGVFRIAEVGKRTTRCVLLAADPREAPPRIAIELAPCVTRAQRMDWLIEKATELGVTAIWPVLAERSIVKARAGGDAAHTERWERLAIAAMKQSRRASKPRVSAPRSLARFLAERTEESRLIVPWERAPTGALGAYFKSCPMRAGDRATLLIGPEGGLSDAEVESLRAAGGQTVSLGASILRAETAAVAMLAILRYEGGDI